MMVHSFLLLRSFTLWIWVSAVILTTLTVSSAKTPEFNDNSTENFSLLAGTASKTRDDIRLQIRAAANERSQQIKRAIDGKFDIRSSLPTGSNQLKNRAWGHNTHHLSSLRGDEKDEKSYTDDALKQVDSFKHKYDILAQISQSFGVTIGTEPKETNVSGLSTFESKDLNLRRGEKRRYEDQANLSDTTFKVPEGEDIARSWINNEKIKALYPTFSRERKLACSTLREKCLLPRGTPDESCGFCICKGGWSGQYCDVCPLYLTCSVSTNSKILPSGSPLNIKRVPDASCTRCECPKGYVSLAPSTHVSSSFFAKSGAGQEPCVDVDECQESMNGGCDPNVRCINTPGSFHCQSCPVGFWGSGSKVCYSFSFIFTVLGMILFGILLRHGLRRNRLYMRSHIDRAMQSQKNSKEKLLVQPDIFDQDALRPDLKQFEHRIKENPARRAVDALDTLSRQMQK